MGRLQQTGWDFGPTPAAPPPKAPEAHQPWSVSEITVRIKTLLEHQFSSVSVRGEISNLRVQSSGHAYFALKDASAQLQCVLFKSAGAEARRLLADGLSVVASGEVGVYEPRGQYQLIVRELVPAGLGALQLAFEQLKRKLKDEGLFDVARKRPLPCHPQCVGLVTSPTGAALKDVIHVLSRRDPGLRLVLAPCRVQGAGAADEIARAIGLLNTWSELQPEGEKLDVILVTRGGGSLEDLWCFNEEVVARAIAASALPVISAVGHEIDFTIADFTADLRAATPSAAAEILSEGAMRAREMVSRSWHGMAQAWRRGFEDCVEGLADLRARLARAHPKRMLEDQSQRVDEWVSRLERAGRHQLQLRAGELRFLRGRLSSGGLKNRIQAGRRSVDQAEARLLHATRSGLTQRTKRVEDLLARLDLLSPSQVLRRGYSITLKLDDGAVVRRPEDVQPGVLLKTLTHGGEVVSRVEANGS